MTEPSPAIAAAEEAAPPPRLLGWTYWAGLTFGLACVLLGLVIGVWGSRLVPPPPAPAALAPEPSPRPPLARVAPATPAPAAPAAPAAARLAALAAVDKAAQGPAPFAAAVQAAAPSLPPGPDLEALRALAEQGAPTRPELAAAWPRAAARAVTAARDPGQNAGLLARAGSLVSEAIVVRRTGRLTGTDVEAVLARTDRAVAGGDLAGAVREAGALAPPARAALAGWLSGAERRLEIEARLSSLKATAA